MVYKLNREVGELKTDFNIFKNNTIISFKNLKSDVSEIKDDLRAIKRKLI